MKLGSAIKFPFRGPNVWMNLGCVAVCFLIPMIGGLVQQGFVVVVQKRLIESLDADAPRFSWNRFMDYLLRGVWPFLAALVFSLVLIPFMMVAGFLFMGGMIAIGNKAEPLGIALVVAAALLYFLFILMIGPLMAPMLFKSAMEGSFSAAFDWPFFKDFFERVGLLTIGSHILLGLIMIPASILSFCVPYLGLFALMTVYLLVHAHWMTQLYVEYLNRGGTPLKIVPEPLEPGAFEVVPPGTLNAQ